MNRYEIKFENGLTGPMKTSAVYSSGDTCTVKGKSAIILRPLKIDEECQRTINGVPFVRGLEESSMEYLEQVCHDQIHREIECPLCGGYRNVEPDARYTYICACGASVKVPSFLGM